MRFSSPGALEKQRTKLQALAGKVKREILICAGTGCLAGGSAEVAEAFRTETKAAGLKVGVRMVIKETGCHGFCEQGPLVILMPEKIFYQKVKPSHVKKIVESTLQKGEVIEKLLYKSPDTGERIKTYDLIDFYAKQHRLVLRNIGRIDPEQLDDYLVVGGYQALPRALASIVRTINGARPVCNTFFMLKLLFRVISRPSSTSPPTSSPSMSRWTPPWPSATASAS